MWDKFKGEGGFTKESITKKPMNRLTSLMFCMYAQGTFNAVMFDILEILNSSLISDYFSFSQ